MRKRAAGGSPAVLSPLDQKRFGVRTAKAADFNSAQWPRLSSFCRDKGVEFCIARCSADDLDAARTLEAQGFRLADTLVYYQRLLPGGLDGVPEPSIEVRPLRRGEERPVRELARRAFRGYPGHYRCDGRLPRRACDEVYADWAYREARAHHRGERCVRVAERNGHVAGFLSIRFNSPQEAEGVLFAVCPRLGRQGVGQTLMRDGVAFCAGRRARRMIISTQVTNLRSQRCWIRCGFEPLRFVHTFHKWFDR
ncbi:MAG: GNAT family N-acetyltransferase [Elusimicrobia bacterium]|nr:GNAT family N-acetyltransferase [Elusimicrobiota bacterium]